VQDILIAASAREVGATIITENTTDFALIGRHVDIAFVTPWPPTPAA
jgi:predicted nucleic acid-binding protein